MSTRRRVKACLIIAACMGLDASAQNVQYVAGNCNLVLGPQGGSVPHNFAMPCHEFSTSKSVADSVAKIERFVEASNPTKIDVSGASVVRWANDNEDYLTVLVANDSQLPALNLRLQALASVRSGEHQSRALKFSPSRALDARLLKHLSIPAGESIQLPIASTSELIRIQGDGIIGMRLIGAGVTADVPTDLITKFRHDAGDHDLDFIQTRAVPFGMALSYANVFGGKTRLVTSIYLYFAREDSTVSGSGANPSSLQTDESLIGTTGANLGTRSTNIPSLSPAAPPGKPKASH